MIFLATSFATWWMVKLADSNNSSDEALMSTGFTWRSTGAVVQSKEELERATLAAVLPRMMGAIWPDVLSQVLRTFDLPFGEDVTYQVLESDHPRSSP